MGRWSGTGAHGVLVASVVQPRKWSEICSSLRFGAVRTIQASQGQDWENGLTGDACLGLPGGPGSKESDDGAAASPSFIFMTLLPCKMMVSSSLSRQHCLSARLFSGWNAANVLAGFVPPTWTNVTMGNRQVKRCWTRRILGL